MGSVCGSAPTTTSTTQAPAWLQQNLQAVQARAQDVASRPYTPYSGQLTAGLNPAQQQAIDAFQHVPGESAQLVRDGTAQLNQGFNNTQNASNYFQQGAAGLGAAQPYYSQAANYASNSAGPLNISQYLNPYQQSVIDTTLSGMQHQDAIAQNGALSTAIKGGAFGGDRAGVAAAELARGQSAERNRTIAGLNAQNYSQALTAAQADANRQANAASIYGGLGNSQVQAGLGYGTLGSATVNQGAVQANQGNTLAGMGLGYQNADLASYRALLDAGQTQQQTEQAGLNAAYQQYQNATGFPYQQTSWLSNIINGGSGAAGGTTTSTGSAPNIFSQIAGGALALGSLPSSSILGAGLMALKRGGVVPERARGGEVSVGVGFPMAGGPIDMNSMPYGGGLIPQIAITPSRLNAPQAVDPNKGQSGGITPSSISGLSKGWLGAPGGAGSSSYGATSAIGDPTGLGGLYAAGGVVPHYAGGGVPSFDDRWAPVDEAQSDFTFQPYKLDATPPAAPPTSPIRDGDVINPGEPFRLEGSYRDQPENNYKVTPERIAANYRGDDAVPGLGAIAAINKAAGVSPVQPPQALAYSDPEPRGVVPQQPANLEAPQAGLGAGRPNSLVGKLFGVDDDGRQTLLSLGLGLLANRSPNFGTALGEAGLGAVSSLNDIHKQRLAQAEKDREFLLKQQQEARAAEAARIAAANQPILPDGTINPAYLKLQEKLVDLREKDPETVRLLEKAGIKADSPEGREIIRRSITGNTASNFGWQTNPDGSISPVKGGPHDPDYLKAETEAKSKNVQKALPSSAVKQLEGAGATYSDFSRLTETFKPEYGGKLLGAIGEVQNTIGRNVGAGYSDQAQWWQDYQTKKNEIRHTLFGSALTSTEKAEFDKQAITPGMTPETIEKNLGRQKMIAERAARKLAQGYLKSGYSREAIEGFLGVPLDQLGVDSPDSKTAAPTAKSAEGKPKLVKQNGYTYELQSDGSYKAVK